MKNKINEIIAKVSAQALSAGDISSAHELEAIGVNKDKQLDLVLGLERSVKDLNGLVIEVSDEVWPSWKFVGDIYRFYGVA